MKLVIERIWPGVDCDEMRQSCSSLQPNRPVCVVESFEEGGLKLREERFEHGAGFREKNGQGVEDSSFDVVTKIKINVRKSAKT